jgi:hypothetical protein
MPKAKSLIRSNQLVAKIEHIAASGQHNLQPLPDLDQLMDQPIGLHPDSSKNPRMKKFRFQLLHAWLTSSFEPCRVADIGGGKGLLGYLLQQSGWDVTVIDPDMQALPGKFKDLASKTRVKIASQAAVPYIAEPFETRHAQGFDLLVAMHAHGCNARILDAAAQYGCGFAIFPCCVIDEPFYPPLGVHWLESLASYAAHQGVMVSTVRLNFKGQNIGLYYLGRCQLRQV